ncbi:hypothetical protein RB9450 [Rhodopirellula baltica SH 1]|uniref:Uncharacterized protein n=1 Tax=Rhodopirellula baltica (strain DSM 10527 / NCIMB 13988 / SH1) TaxID=243090 RepID=Q7ULJ9_RHOBA|nr:hypothetical protein RB9450 [Rhodopirellula baltica SH 1]
MEIPNDDSLRLNSPKEAPDRRQKTHSGFYDQRCPGTDLRKILRLNEAEATLS